MIYTQEHVDELRGLLADKVPFLSIKLATLGGIERASIMFLICLDHPDTWPNKIMENSRYARFSAESPENKLQMFSGGYLLAKFRKCKVDSVEAIAGKLIKWIDQNKEQ